MASNSSCVSICVLQYIKGWVTAVNAGHGSGKPLIRVLLVMTTIFGPTFFAATAHAVIQWLVDIIFPLL